MLSRIRRLRTAENFDAGANFRRAALSLIGGSIAVEDFEDYLAACEVIDWRSPSVLSLAKKLQRDDDQVADTARRSFEWVRDNVQHSFDYQRNPVTCSASEVLESRTGICYAKSHLLAALLRANGIPAGFCFQRLRFDQEGGRFCLHGLNAVHLPVHGWYRVDSRGNNHEVDAQFRPPVEQLAFATQARGELDFSKIHSKPLAVVVATLQKHDNWESLMDDLPDATGDA